MKYRIRTGEKPQQIYINVIAQKPCTIRIVANDSFHKNSIYERVNKGGHEMSFQGRKTFAIKLPISPKQLTIDISCSLGDGNIKTSFEQAALDETKEMASLSKDLVEFVRFVAPFVKKAGYMRADQVLKSPSGKFQIKFLKNIIDGRTGQAIETPARIERRTGIIEINAKIFRTYSIPMRMFILLHEIMHRHLQTRSEFKADDGAAQIYEGLGFPRIEAIYSYSKVFDNESPEQEKRKKVMLQKMMGYKKSDTRSAV